MKVFVDSDVILDVLLKREGFHFSSELLDLLLEKKSTLLTSPVVFTNSYYIISKLENKQTAFSALNKLRKLFHVCAVNEIIIDKALKSDYKDFEDAVQYYSAENAKCNYLVTRNTKDYKGTEIEILDPKEMIALVNSN